MSLRQTFFAALPVLLLSSVLLGSTPTFTSSITPTFTDTKTVSPTNTVTPTFSSTFTVTPLSGSSTHTKTVSPTNTITSTLSSTFTKTPATTTASSTVTLFVTQSMTWTISPTFTASPTPAGALTASPTPSTTALTPVPTIDPLLDDFEDGDLVGKNGGFCFGTNDGLGSSCNVTLTAGSTLTLSSKAGHCSGTLMPLPSAYAFMVFQIRGGGAPADIAGSCPSHAITFSYQGDIVGQSLYFSLTNGSDGLYDYTWTVTDTNWHQITLYFPDVSDPSLSPKLAESGTRPWSSGGGAIAYCSFAAQPNGSVQPYSFSIDDVSLGEPASNNSPAQVSTGLGMPIDDVQEAYSYQLDEQLTWIIIRLAAHCGCHPHDIMTMRETRSWGQIAIDLGTTWATVIGEVDAATSLLPPTNDAVNIERSLLNGVLPPAPGVRAQFYVPAGNYAPTPMGGCP